MALELTTRLTNVVVTAEHHRPQILSADFLSACGIVPQEWNAIESSVTEESNTVEYHNGVFWYLDNESLIIEDDRTFDFGGEIEIHDLAMKYIQEVRAIPYRALGLNFYLAFPDPDPHAWIANRFMSPNLRTAHDHGIRILPRFAISSDDANTTIILGGPETDFDDPPLDGAVLISVHVYREGLADATGVMAALEAWPATKRTVANAMSLLLGAQ